MPYPPAGEDVDGLATVPTLTVAFDVYRRELRLNNRSPNTITGYSNTLNSLLRFYGPEANLSYLTYDTIRDYIEWLRKSHVKTGTIRLYLSKTRVVLSHMRLMGHDTLDPNCVPLPIEDAQRVPEVLNTEEVQRLIDAEKLLRNKAIISLLFSSGLRMGELISLNRSHVREDYFTVRKGKGRFSRICFIDRRTRSLLDAYLKTRTDNDACLFYSQAIGGRLGHATIEYVFKNARRKAGFDWPVTAHKLRHSFATNLLKNGADLFSISKMLGHKNPNTTAIYLHLVDRELEDTYRKYHTT